MKIGEFLVVIFKESILIEFLKVGILTIFIMHEDILKIRENAAKHQKCREKNTLKYLNM